MDLAEMLRGYLGQSGPPDPDYAAPLRPMVDPAARTRAVAGSPETQQAVGESLQDIVRGAVEPFQQIGRAISGRSDNPVPEALLGGLGIATAIPGGIAKGALKAGAKAAEKAGVGGVEDMIRAYHGSPHDFDRFDLSKIGTGEGAQAYGHGLYFAENEGVAKGYRNNLAGAKEIKIDDKPVWNEGQSILGRVDLPRDQQLALDAYSRFNDAKQAANFLRGRTGQYEGKGFHEARNAAVEMLEAGRVSAENKGRMYEVGIRANPEHFLDWDKPVREQSEAVQKLFPYLPKGNEAPGDFHFVTKPEFSEKLREAGIPGIKYLDQGSRGKGDGTRNFVVFDDKLIDILKKYGIAGIGALPAMNAFHYQDKQ